MSSRLERKSIFESGSPLRKHSLNQKNLKHGRKGERRLGIVKSRTESKKESFIGELSKNELGAFLVLKAEQLEKSNFTIPKKIGQIAVTISQIINNNLKENPDDFSDPDVNFQRLKFLAGSQYKNLIPTQQMVLDYLRETNQLRSHPAIRQQTQNFADEYSQNLGGIVFNEGTDIIVGSMIIATSNISHYLTDQIKNKRFSIPHARKMIVVFG
jgi:hypothetical protein